MYFLAAASFCFSKLSTLLLFHNTSRELTGKYRGVQRPLAAAPQWPYGVILHLTAAVWMNHYVKVASMVHRPRRCSTKVRHGGENGPLRCGKRAGGLCVDRKGTHLRAIFLWIAGLKCAVGNRCKVEFLDKLSPKRHCLCC